MLNACYKTPVGATGGRPLIIDVYAGPGTQKVRQTHDMGMNLQYTICGRRGWVRMDW